MRKLLQGNCLEKMKDIPDGSVDMVLTDPPYGTTACKWDSIIPLVPMWQRLKQVIKSNGAIIMTASQPFTTNLINSNRLWFRYELIWQKERGQNFIQAKRQPLKSHENILVFYNKQPVYNPQMDDAPKENIRKPQYHTSHKTEVYRINKMPSHDYDMTKRYPKSVLFFKSGRARDKIHPTQKPVALMEYLIKTYTNEGETVLDFAMGSGTTGVACGNLNRNFIGIELDETYFEMANKRIKKVDK